MSLTTDVIDPRARVLELLAKLGDTEEQVAASLRKLGVTGLRGEPCGCPIFYYLRDAGIPISSVRFGLAILHDHLPVELPAAVAEFVSDFDAYPGAWPELVEPEAVNL